MAALLAAHILLFYAACGLMLRAIVMRKYLKTIVRAMDRLERQDIYDTLAEFVESQKNPIGLPEKLKRALTGGPSASPRWSLSWQIMRKVVPRKPDFREHHRTREGARSPLPPAPPPLQLTLAGLFALVPSGNSAVAAIDRGRQEAVRLG